MTFLNATRPFLSDDDSVNIRVSRKDGKINVLIEPRVKLIDPETEDAELANIQRALVMPLLIRVEHDVDDLDGAVAEALSGMNEARAASVSSLSAFKEAQAEARNNASIAAKSKSVKGSTSKGATPAESGKTAAASPTAQALPAQNASASTEQAVVASTAATQASAEPGLFD